MEGPIYPTTFPFRPIPVYGHLAPNVITKVPTPGTALTQYGLKKPEDNRTLVKHLDVVNQMNHLRALGEYQLEQLRSLRGAHYNQLYEGLEKFNRTAVAAAPLRGVPFASNVDPLRPQAHTDMSGPVDFSNAKARVDNSNSSKINNTSVTATPGNTSIVCAKSHLDRPSAVTSANLTVPADRVTVPVIVSCANPFGSQYGYGRKVFPCPQCRYTTDRRNNLKRHMLTMHQNCSKVLECCGILFATKASLREHAMIFHYHGYTCFYCGRRFCRKALLKRHLSVHNGQKDFVCAVCDYATSHKSNLERHRKVHCRPEDMKSDDSDGVAEYSPSLESWRSRERVRSPSSESCRSDVGSRDENVILSYSDDESEEIIVDSDD